MLNVVEQSVSSVSTTQKHGLGQRYADKDGNEYIYLKAGEAIAAGDLVTFDMVASVLTALKSLEANVLKQHFCAVAEIAVASGEYFWATAKKESVSINALASAAADVIYYATTTAGSVDDAGTTRLHGIHVHTAIASGQVTATINYPHP